MGESVCCGSDAARTADTASQTLADEMEIRNLVARMAHLADHGDLTDYATCLTEDASWHLPPDQILAGRDAILRDRAARRAAGTQGPGSGTHHLNTTMHVVLDGDDSARASSHFLLVTSSPQGPRVQVIGRYADTFRRTASGWRLNSRRIHDNFA